MGMSVKLSVQGRPLVWISGLALVIRVLWVAATHYTPAGDAVDYDRIAGSIADGHGYGPTVIAAPGTASAYRPPGYPYLLALVYKLSGNSWTAGRLLGAVLGALAVFALMMLADWLRDRPTAVAAGLIAAVYPPLLDSSAGALLSEALFVPAMLGTLLAAVAYRRSERRLAWAVAAGVLCGVAALTRGNGILLLIPLALALWMAPGAARRGRVVALTGAVVVLVLVLAPWTVRNFDALHGFVPISTELGPTAAAVYDPAFLSQPASQPASGPRSVGGPDVAARRPSS